MLNLLRKLVLAASLGAGIASFVSVASALPVLDALAIKNAAPPTLEGGASQLGQRESSDNPMLNAFWRVALRTVLNAAQLTERWRARLWSRRLAAHRRPWIGGSPIYLSELGSGLGFDRPCRDLRLGRVTFPMT